MARKQPTPPQTNRPSRIRWKLVVLLPILGTCVGAYWAYQTPSGLYWRAKRLEDSDPARAEELVIESVELADRDYPAAQLFWCRLLAKSNQWTEALGCFGLIQSPEKCNQSELFDLAKQAWAAHQILLTEKALEAANRPGEDQEEVLSFLIEFKQQMGQRDEALDLAKQLSELFPQSSRPWQVMGQIYADSKQLPEAKDACHKALERSPSPEEEVTIRATLVQVFLNRGDIRQAREEMNRLLELKSGPPSIPILHAMLLRLEGKLEKALEEIERVLKQKSPPGADMVRGMILFDQGNYKLALPDFKQVVERDPYNKEAHYKLAQCASQLGTEELAQKHRKVSQRLTNAALELLDVQNALADDPQNTDLLRELAELYQTLGQHERANQIRRSVAALQGNDASSQ